MNDLSLSWSQWWLISHRYKFIASFKSCFDNTLKISQSLLKRLYYVPYSLNISHIKQVRSSFVWAWSDTCHQKLVSPVRNVPRFTPASFRRKLNFQKLGSQLTNRKSNLLDLSLSTYHVWFCRIGRSEADVTLLNSLSKTSNVKTWYSRLALYYTTTLNNLFCSLTSWDISNIQIFQQTSIMY